jgi:SAM-dependent methyltransferase
MFQYTDAGAGKMPAAGGARAESISSVSGATTTSSRTMQSSEQASESAYQLRPFVVRNGRTYLADPTLPYPLPVDLEELHRQSLQTMLLMQLFGRPICAPAFADKPPPRILEVGCGTGFWSMMCYRHYQARGLHKDMSFTGIDIVPLPPNAPHAGDTLADALPDKDMNWRFVQHDLRRVPFPFPDGSFDLVMVKDVGLTTSTAMQQALVEEYIRLLSPGGTLEIWETDHMLRMLRPHVPECATTSGPPATTDQDDTFNPSTTQGGLDNNRDGDHPHDTTSNNTNDHLGGAYIMTPNTPLSTPLNNFLVEYNAWIQRALESRALCAMPCTVIGPLLIQEAEMLTGVGSRRLAVPLSEIRWEKEGVGGVVTKDGKSYIESKARKGISPGGGGAGGAGGAGVGGKDGTGVGGGGLDPAAAALRRTALMIVVGRIQSLEPVLREASGKSQDEWDAWVGKMMNDLVRENGTSWGECLEVGAWWARKR